MRKLRISSFFQTAVYARGLEPFLIPTTICSKARILGYHLRLDFNFNNPFRNVKFYKLSHY